MSQEFIDLLIDEMVHDFHIDQLDDTLENRIEWLENMKNVLFEETESDQVPTRFKWDLLDIIDEQFRLKNIQRKINGGEVVDTLFERDEWWYIHQNEREHDYYELQEKY